MKNYLIPAVALAALLFASHAEAGPIRNVLSRLKGKPRAVAAKVVNVVKAPVRALGGCANGHCRAAN